MTVNIVEIQIISANLFELHENPPNTYVQIKWNKEHEEKRTETVYNSFNPNYEELDDQLSWNHEAKEGDILYIYIMFVQMWKKVHNILLVQMLSSVFQLR